MSDILPWEVVEFTYKIHINPYNVQIVDSWKPLKVNYPEKKIDFIRALHSLDLGKVFCTLIIFTLVFLVNKVIGTSEGE